MIVIYIAGKYRGSDPWETERNVRKAEELAYQVAQAGFAPMCPHTNTRFFDGTCTPEFWLDATMEMMRRCDAVLMVDNWRDSAGAKAEMAEAYQLPIPVFENVADLVEWGIDCQ